MTNFSVIENKISSIEKYLKILVAFKKFSKKEIVNNITIRGAVERYLYLVTQAVIDLAEATISLRDLRRPTTMSESFDILLEERAISKTLAEKMSRLVGFRNIMAHEYEKVDYAIVYDVLQNKMLDIKAFLTAIRKFLKIRK